MQIHPSIELWFYNQKRHTCSVVALPLTFLRHHHFENWWQELKVWLCFQQLNTGWDLDATLNVWLIELWGNVWMKTERVKGVKNMQPTFNIHNKKTFVSFWFGYCFWNTSFKPLHDEKLHSLLKIVGYKAWYQPPFTTLFIYNLLLSYVFFIEWLSDQASNLLVRSSFMMGRERTFCNFSVRQRSWRISSWMAR